jgi:hypothetical protein
LYPIPNARVFLAAPRDTFHAPRTTFRASRGVLTNTCVPVILSLKMIEQIRAKIAQGKLEFTKHALVVIEDYPDDKYGPSCLILGFTRSNRP